MKRERREENYEEKREIKKWERTQKRREKDENKEESKKAENKEERVEEKRESSKKEKTTKKKTKEKQKTTAKERAMRGREGGAHETEEARMRPAPFPHSISINTHLRHRCRSGGFAYRPNTSLTVGYLGQIAPLLGTFGVPSFSSFWININIWINIFRNFFLE